MNVRGGYTVQKRETLHGIKHFMGEWERENVLIKIVIPRVLFKRIDIANIHSS